MILPGAVSGGPVGGGATVLFSSSDLTTGWITVLTMTVDSSTTASFVSQYDRLTTDWIAGTLDSTTYRLSAQIRNISGNTDLYFYHDQSETGTRTAVTIDGSLTEHHVDILGRAGGGTIKIGIEDRNAAGQGQIEFTSITLTQL